MQKRTDVVIDRWWLLAGEEECTSCGRTYVFEAELRCGDCDTPMCPLCAAWHEQRPRCRACPEEPS